VAEAEARELIANIRREIEEAADAMLAAAEKGLRDIESVRGGDAQALDGLERMLCAILEACAFQDLAGQRLTRLNSMIGAVALGAVGGDPLLEGPQAQGQGLDQAAADALFGDGTS